jgi:predicted amidohydrolase YtcJ
MDHADPTMSRLAIRHGRVVADIDTAHHEIDQIDLRGRCVIPGMTDSHVHFPTWALKRLRVELDDCGSLSEVQVRLASASAGHPGDGWLTGFGWRAHDWGDIPNRQVLDEICNSRPVALWSKDYHSLWLNSAALQLADGDGVLAGELAERDGDGELTGVLRENAAWTFRDRHLKDKLEEQVEATLEGIQEAHRRGVTAIHDKDGWLGAVRIWQQIAKAGRLTMRVWQTLPAERMEVVSNLGLESGIGDDFLKLGALKVFVDGALGSSTACMSDGSGVLITTMTELEELIEQATHAGWPVAVHAIGDVANKVALDAFEATRDLWFPAGLRQRVEHAQHVAPADLKRFAQLGVACSVQFSHAVADRDLTNRLANEIIEGSFAFRTLVDSGALVANGSDAPVDHLDPLHGIRSAVLRTLDSRPAWRSDEALTVEQALEASTSNPPWLTHDESWRGKLTPGYVADLVVLSADPISASPEELAEIEVVATMVGGEWVHGEPPWD